jgi:hypothetical protein
VYWSEKYGEKVPQRIENPIMFEGITVLTEEKQSVKEDQSDKIYQLFSHFFDANEWVLGQSPVGNPCFRWVEKI